LRGSSLQYKRAEKTMAGIDGMPVEQLDAGREYLGRCNPLCEKRTMTGIDVAGEGSVTGRVVVAWV
jgi:hypothetical protein